MHNLTPPSARLMRASYVIALNVVEKFWTPTHRHSYTTVSSNHAERLANKHPAGSYLYNCSKYQGCRQLPPKISLAIPANWLVIINGRTGRAGGRKLLSNQQQVLWRGRGATNTRLNTSVRDVWTLICM